MLAWMDGTNAQHARRREQLSIDTVTRLFAAARPTALETVTKFVVCPSSRRPVTHTARVCLLGPDSVAQLGIFPEEQNLSVWNASPPVGSRVARVTAGLAESSGSLLPGL